jgi:glycosyltransferase involved in cell wall biosynthesis
VSVIVPVRNDAARIGRCLEALLAQTWPPDRLEVIVVDNGSVDETRGRVRDFPVTLLVERSARSPYAARNLGLARAGGEILAFTDADCVPAKDWIERGVAKLAEEEVDLVGGCVEFRFSEPPRAAELVDALHNLDNERSIADRGVAKTGNLLVLRRVFDALGPFDGQRRSGGDVEFTARASGAGFHLAFAPEARVEKPARRAWALARKQYRVGRGQLTLWRGRGETRPELWKRTLRCFRPVRPRAIRVGLARRGAPGSERRAGAVWLTDWAMTAVQGLGQLHARIGRRP